MEKGLYCPKCGQRYCTDDGFCSMCGAEIKTAAPNGIHEHIHRYPQTSQIKQIRWAWLFRCILIIMILECIAIVIMIIASNVFELPFGSADGIPVWTIITVVSSMIFVGSLITALLSPGKTIVEPAIAGALMPVIASAIFAMLVLLIRGYLSGELFDLLLPNLLFGWILPCVIGLAGAKVGEYLSGRVGKQKHLRLL